jgi:1,2-phenylacetyl-CoA epoxidase catalytic subunit
MNARDGNYSRPVENDELDYACQTILASFQKATAIAEQNTQQALSSAHRLAVQLRASEDRIAELEAAFRAQYARADRAEEWLKRISKQIDQWTSTQSGRSTQPVATTEHGPPPPRQSLPPGVEPFVKRRA